ncbi:MAG: flavin reductase family protein [Reinekea sp.]|nr:flavin reductase family protein [Reinekea sp.]
MFLNLNALDKSLVYRLLTHTVVPRPIAWVLTENEQGNHNVAPFSYFNIVCSDPAILMFSVGHKRDGSKKDTWQNIERNGKCVVHIATGELMPDVNESARTLPAGDSELNGMSVSLVEDAEFSLPRIQQCPVAFDCEKHDIHLLGNGPQAVIYVRVNAAYLSDHLDLSDRFTLSEKTLNPLARLGEDRFSLLGDINAIPRPE